jgi:hypothetical protein
VETKKSEEVTGVELGKEGQSALGHSEALQRALGYQKKGFKIYI